MRVTFLCGLSNVAVGVNSDRGDKIGNGLLLTCNNSIAESFLNHDAKKAMGELESGFLRNASALVYSDEELDEKDFDWYDYLTRRLYYVHHFLHCLWLVKDNAANVELGFIICDRGSVHSNFIANRYSDSNGRFDSVAFSGDETKMARRYFREALSTDLHIQVPWEPMPSAGRLSRAFYWFQAARSMPSLGSKVAAYCTALESMFATSPSELTHQLAERVASFLQSGSERVRVYRNIKRAYSYRSKVVHGSQINPSKHEQITRASSDLDQYSRAVFMKCIEDANLEQTFNLPSERFDEFMIHLILTGERLEQIPPGA